MRMRGHQNDRNRQQNNDDRPPESSAKRFTHPKHAKQLTPPTQRAVNPEKSLFPEVQHGLLFQQLNTAQSSTFNFRPQRRTSFLRQPTALTAQR